MLNQIQDHLDVPYRTTFLSFFLLNMTVYCNEAQYPSTIVGKSKYGA